MGEEWIKSRAALPTGFLSVGWWAGGCRWVGGWVGPSISLAVPSEFCPVPHPFPSSRLPWPLLSVTEVMPRAPGTPYVVGD